MPIDAYDPFNSPDPVEWLALDDQERIGLVLDYHHRIGERGENEQIHCTVQAIIENQVATGDRMPVRDKLRQLMAQGLDRHQALHAIAYVLGRHMERLTRQPARGDQEERYFNELRRMTARKFMAVSNTAWR